MRKVLAFDLGGTKFAFGVVNQDGTVLGSGRVETFAEKGPQQACERVAAAAHALLAELKLKPIDFVAIGVASPGPLAVGGLWSLHLAADGTHRRTLCLVTVAPNREAGEIHSRMPIVLTGTDRQVWLSEKAFAAEDFARLAATAPDRALSLHRVSPDVNRVAIDAERLVQPLVGAMDQPDFFGDLLG
jgi:hypothetical protein